MTGPLEGVRVLDLSEGVAGPYCALELADGGADVIKIERPAGDRARGWGTAGNGTLGAAFIHYNRNKRGIAVDTNTDAGVEIVQKLAAQADVVVADAGWTGKKELQYDALGAANSKLIYTRFTMFGEDGPWALRPPFGEMPAQLSAETYGSLGRIGQAPVRMATDLGSMYAAIYAVQGTCAALIAQDTAGGQRVDVSLFGSLLAMRSTLWVALSNPDEWWGFHLDSYTKAPDYGYRCKDGFIYMTVARASAEQREQMLKDLKLWPWVKEDPQWPLFSTDSAGGGGRYSAQVKHLWERGLAHFTREEAMEIVIRNGGWAFPKNDYDQLVNHPQSKAVGLTAEVEQAGVGKLRMQTPPFDFHGTPVGIRMGAPLLGQHNAEVLAEVGYSAADVTRLAGEGVLASS